METADKTGLRLAVYARVSSEEREGQTIDSQIAELERFAAERQWVVAQVYKDDGWSGSLMARPALDQLRDDAGNGLFTAVLINDVDRLARDVAHLGVVKRDLERRGVAVIFRKLPHENSPTHNLMVNILGSFAEFERELILDRTRRGRRHKVEVRKQYLGCNTAYGYRYTPAEAGTGAQGKLEINPAEAAVVRRMFRWVSEEGLSGRAVLKRLNEQGVRPRKGTRWGKSSVLRILRSEMYAGVWYYNKQEGCEPSRPRAERKYRALKTGRRTRPRTDWIPLQLPASLHIVSRTQWDQVQAQLDRNITYSPRNGRHEYLLRGLVRCAGCGARYVGDPAHGKFSYRCMNRCRKCPMVAEHLLDEPVWDAIAEVMGHPETITRPLLELRRRQATTQKADDSERRESERDLEQAQREEARILEAYRLGAITPAILGSELQNLRRRIDAARTRLAEVAARAAISPQDIDRSVHEYCNEARRRLDTFDKKQKQEFLRRLVTEIVFDGGTAKISGRIPISLSTAQTEAEPEPKPFVFGGRIESEKIDHHGRNTPQWLRFKTEVELLHGYHGHRAKNIKNSVRHNRRTGWGSSRSNRTRIRSPVQ